MHPISHPRACALAGTGLALILSTALAACGGGGGSDGATSATASVDNAPTQSGSTSTVAATATGVSTTTLADSTGVGFNSGANAASGNDTAVSAQTPGISASSPVGVVTTTPSSGLITVNVGTTATPAPTSPGGTNSGPTTTAATPTTTAATTGGTTTMTSGADATNTLATISAAASTVPVSTVQMQRPAYSTGTGFFVSGTRVYDPSGMEFRIRGVNHNHWDQTGATTGIPLTGANTSRIHIDFTQSTTTTLKVINAAIGGHVVPIAGNWTGTCYADTAHLTNIVNTWVAQAPQLAPTLNAHGMVNIANEWGPANSTVWRDSYITAIARMRAAGYTGTLVIDSGGCGQDVADLVKYGPAVLASDPQGNILFDLHVYGAFAEPATTSRQGLLASMAALQASGLPVVIGEFGPGNNIGPSPTTLSPVQVVTAAETAGFGWLVWAYDDNDLAGCKTSDSWFGLVNFCAVYTGSDSQLTSFGLQMVPILKLVARPAAML